MPKQAKRRKTSRKHKPKGRFECVSARFGPGGWGGRGYRCRSKHTGTWVKQGYCRACPRSVAKRGKVRAPKKFTTYR